MAARETNEARGGGRRPSRALATPKARRTRRQILDTSLALFRERGFDETSMRDVAARAGLSLGSAYYYFPSKDALVLEYYRETQDEAARRNAEVVASTRSFAERLRDLVDFKLAQLETSRPMVAVLARTAVDPKSPLSPFSEQTRYIRDDAIEMLEAVIEGSDARMHAELRPHLAKLLWLYQMGILFLWLHDRSPERARTRRVVDRSLALLALLLPLTAAPIPGMRGGVRTLVSLVRDLVFWEGATIDAA